MWYTVCNRGTHCAYINSGTLCNRGTHCAYIIEEHVVHCIIEEHTVQNRVSGIVTHIKVHCIYRNMCGEEHTWIVDSRGCWEWNRKF